MAVTVGIGSAVIGAGSSIAGGIMKSNAYSDANEAAQQYYNQALNYEKGIYTDATTNLTPWISGGQEALSGLESFLGLGTTGGGTGGTTGASGSGALQSYTDFTKTPYYTFPLQQATDTMNREAAGKGLSLSGGQLASLGKYGEGYSASNFSNFISGLSSLSGSGQTAATNLGNIGQNISSQVSNTSNQQAGSAAGSILGSASAWSDALTGVTNSLTGGAGTATGSSYGSNNSGLLGALSQLFSSGGNNTTSGGFSLAPGTNNSWSI